MAKGQGRSSGQGVKLLYIRDYLYTYTNRENPKNAKHIVEYLASKGIEASPKTIYNDILRLQIDFGVPVEYNPSKWGYYITQTSVYKGYKRDKIEMRGDRAEISDFPLYLNTVAGGLDRRDQAIGGFSFVVKIYAVPVVEIIG